MLQKYLTQLQPYLQYYFLGNTVGMYLWALSLFLVGLIAKYIFINYLARKVLLYLNRNKLVVPPQQITYFIKRPVGFFINLILLYNALIQLSFPPQWQLAPPTQWGLRMWLAKGYEVLLVIAFAWILLQLTNLVSSILSYRANQTDDKTDNQIIYFMKELTKVLIVMFALFFVLSNTFQVNVTSILAGLGIGGLAVALAGKETIENLFASFTIFLDKPFIVGDFVQINQIQGTVEKVGFRSTRIRTIDQSYLTLPNKMMIDNPLDNLTKRDYRRARFSIDIVLSTPAEKIRQLIADIKEYLSQHPNASQLEHLVVWNSFKESSFEILVIYFLNIPDFVQFHIVKGEINFKILEILEKNEIQLAYPTQTLYLKKEEQTETETSKLNQNIQKYDEN
ncbi:MAG: mechanosensitive ion channel family protein [Microscillaceae bacterium]|nr:mechanosensitive ion channel family protein [Microscillaceae bacterium]MDW8459794.1 mechanosensitive ion channel family protein [Cytophagales bacterium]